MESYFSIFLLISVITISAIEDLRRQKIPNMVTFPTMVMALGIHFIEAGPDGFLFGLGGLALGMVIFLVPYTFGGMGAGDVKLMGAIGAILGAKAIFITSIMVIIIGGVYGLILLAMSPRHMTSFVRRWWLTAKTFARTLRFIPIPPDKAEKQPVLKYAIPIALGTMGYMAMQYTGYDLFPELLGIKFSLFSIAQGGTW